MFLVMAVTIVVHAQQVASKDLLRPPAALAATAPHQVDEKPESSKGCSKMGGGIADGVTLGEDKLPRKISIDLVKISSTKLAIGSEIVATAKLQNVGEKSVQIPWSTDFRTTMDGQDPDNRFWEFGEFRMSIRDTRNPNYYDRLVTTSQPLYASKFVADSNLTLKPGEWITAQISFKVEVQNPKFEELNVGTADLAMEWFQTVRTRSVKDCGVTLGYFPYDDPFDSLNRKVVARVQIERPGVTTDGHADYDPGKEAVVSDKTKGKRCDCKDCGCGEACQ
jgi:hypothetical protein